MSWFPRSVQINATFVSLPPWWWRYRRLTTPHNNNNASFRSREGVLMVSSPNDGEWRSAWDGLFDFMFWMARISLLPSLTLSLFPFEEVPRLVQSLSRYSSDSELFKAMRKGTRQKSIIWEKCYKMCCSAMNEWLLDLASALAPWRSLLSDTWHVFCA